MMTAAVIGGGAAGMGAARSLLMAGLDVTLIESAPRLGGNCVADEVRGDPCGRYAVDVGVSDFNRTTFREFSRLVVELGVETRPIGTDASFATPDGRTLASSRNGSWHFAPDVRDPVRFVAGMDRFRARAVEVLTDPRFADWSVERYLDHLRVSPELRRIYVYARAMGSFPMPDRSPATYPIRDLIAFWQIHGVVGRAPADRHAVVGGMHRYTDAFRSWFVGAGGHLASGAHVQSVRRIGAGWTSGPPAEMAARCASGPIDSSWPRAPAMRWAFSAIHRPRSDARSAAFRCSGRRSSCIGIDDSFPTTPTHGARTTTWFRPGHCPGFVPRSRSSPGSCRACRPGPATCSSR